MDIIAGIEIGGTKTIVAIAAADGVIAEQERFVTSDGGDTLARVIAWLRVRSSPDGIGIASFGPLQLNHKAADYGFMLSTPKPGWTGYPILAAVREAFPRAVVRLETDVNAAALAEADGLENLAYITTGTGVGAGIIAGGRLLQGHGHPEFSHIRVRRISEDHFPGACPFHGDCLEGMTSGVALLRRWGRPAEDLPDSHQAWDWQARYLAHGLLALVAIASPSRIVLGGGLSQRAGLHSRIEAELRYLAGRYFPVLDDAPYVVPPRHGQQAGLHGALLLAMRPECCADTPYPVALRR